MAGFYIAQASGFSTFFGTHNELVAAHAVTTLLPASLTPERRETGKLAEHVDDFRRNVLLPEFRGPIALDGGITTARGVGS